jgi:hypothetical protein
MLFAVFTTTVAIEQRRLPKTMRWRDGSSTPADSCRTLGDGWRLCPQLTDTP